MEESKNTDLKSALAQLETTLAEYFVTKAPFALPKSIKEIIVSFGPWVILIMMILTLPFILLALGLGTVLAPLGFLGGVTAGTTGLVSLVFAVILVVMELMALPGLFKRAKSAWNLLFYIQLLSLVQNLISLNLGGVIIGGLVGFYILFQVREYYK